MASLYVAFVKVGATSFGGVMPVADGEAATSETVTTSASNAQSAAAPAGKAFVRVVSDAAHWVTFGSNPDATVTTGRFYLPANTVEYFQIEIGNKVAAVTA